MNSYDDKLETLLLTKDFSALSKEEGAHALACLGTAEAYAAERVLRLRSRSVLAAEAAPEDPNGLAAVMGRVRRKRRAVVPLWQAAAAIALVAVLAWWGRGRLEKGEVEKESLFATVDTLFQEVRVVDTVYLPAPSETPPPTPPRYSPRPKKPERRQANPSRTPDYIAEALAELPAPDIAQQSSGLPPASDLHLAGLQAPGDKFQGEF